VRHPAIFSKNCATNRLTRPPRPCAAPTEIESALRAAERLERAADAPRHNCSEGECTFHVAADGVNIEARPAKRQAAAPPQHSRSLLNLLALPEQWESHAAGLDDAAELHHVSVAPPGGARPQPAAVVAAAAVAAAPTPSGWEAHAAGLDDFFGGARPQPAVPTPTPTPTPKLAIHHDEPPPPTEAQQQMAAGKLAAVHVLNASMLGALALLFIFSASSTILSCFS